MEKVFDNNTNDYMYRYLEKYVGTYRVLAEIDKDTGVFPSEDSFEDFYIPCGKNCVIKHTYEGNDILSLCFYNSIGTANNVEKELKKQNIEHEIDADPNCVDVHILFNAKDMKKVAKIVKPRTNGRTIKPLSKKNLKNNNKITSSYRIPDKDLEELSLYTKNLSRMEKLHFFKKVNKEFIDILSKKNNRDYLTKMKEKGLNAKQYIHMHGFWDEYVKFVNKKSKNK